MFKRMLFVLIALSLLIPVAGWTGERVVTVGGNKATRPITDFGINIVDKYYVDSENGDDGRAGTTTATALATLDYAIGLCTANQGDEIHLLANSDETVATAGAIAVDVAGIKIIGHGIGADRPTFTFSTTASTMTFSAASCSIENVLLVPSVDNVASAIVVSAANVSIDVEVQDESATVEFVRAILTTAAADNLTISLKYRGFIAGTAGVTPIQLVGCDTARIYVDYYGEASTAVVNFITTACLDIYISGYFFNDNVALTKNVVDTEGNGDWFVEGFDGKGGYEFTGSDAIALAAGGNTSVQADATLAIEADNLDHFLTLDGATQVYPENAIDDSILAKLCSKSDPADISDYDNSTDSFEAIGDAVAAIEADTEAQDTNTEINVLWAHPRCVAKTDGAVLTGLDPIFTITGGPVRAKIVGLVTTLVGGASNGRLQHITTTPSATVELSAGAVAINDDAAGTFYFNLGAWSTFTPSTGLGFYLMDPVSVEETELLLAPGIVQFLGSAAQDGVIAWYMTYVPLSPNSVVVATP